MDISAIFGLLDSFFAVAENVGVPKEISQFIVFTVLFLAVAIYVWQKIYHWIPKRSSLEPPAQTPQPTENIDFSRLPKPATVELIGRGDELKKLTTALKNKDKRLVYIQASGGVGKSALIFKWLKDMQPDYHGASKVFAWSFYSQGSHDTQNSSIPFFQEALPFFGYSDELPKDDVEKGRTLAKCLRNQSFILILDGLEPLQHPTHILDGELKDVALKALFADIEYHGLNQSPSLIVVSSRQPLVELPSWAAQNYQTIDLQTLSNEHGAKLLRKLGVTGTDEELQHATQEMGGHALALVLLGKMLVAQFNGDIARRDQLPMVQTALESLESSQALSREDEKLYRHVRRVLQWYADFYTENNTPEAIFLNLLSLFDRPLGLAEKNELVKKADFAAPLRDLNQVEWQQLEKSLENAGLLLRHEGMRTEWDCHPLIRSYFAQQFETTHPDLFRQAHLILFEYYQQVSYYLMSLGRLTEAVEPGQASLKMSAKQKDWKNASIYAHNLVDLLLPLGRLEEAAAAATQAIDYAEKSADLFGQMVSHATRATVLHRQGQLATEAFEKAEQLQQQWQPEYPQLYSIWGFQYCAWLLDQPNVDLSQVVARGEYSLKIAIGRSRLLDISLGQLTLARAYRQLGDTTQATDYFEKAVSRARKSGRVDHLVYFLIDRANFYLDQQQFPEVKRDLAEAWQIIQRSDMKLYAVDYHLAMRRAEPENAQFHETEAKKLIAATGYHLRDKNV